MRTATTKLVLVEYDVLRVCLCTLVYDVLVVFYAAILRFRIRHDRIVRSAIIWTLHRFPYVALSRVDNLNLAKAYTRKKDCTDAIASGRSVNVRFRCIMSKVHTFSKERTKVLASVSLVKTLPSNSIYQSMRCTMEQEKLIEKRWRR